jgi:hypothetical protein
MNEMRPAGWADAVAAATSSDIARINRFTRSSMR